jgi:isoleucyl-tRNA synthetase
MEHNEEKTLKFWKESKIYEKSKKKNAKGKKFYFMDGPPYATGQIHMGTALNKILKDIAMRGQRLQGKDVFDRAGYDMHGVPIEFKVEKEIESKSKKDIEKYGVKKFIEKCKKFATEHIDMMSEEFENLGVWMNLKKPYLTLAPEYIEKIWETFKYADKKGLLYLGKYPVHTCPRCETAVAFNEIIYNKQEDTSIFVKFPLKEKKNTHLIIWTTTPWTLPGNTGVMVNPNFTYEEIELSNGEKWIMAKDLVPKIMAELGMGFTAKEEFLGKDMKGWKYENPLEKNINVKLNVPRQVVLSSRYVNLEEGTGLVHTAPGHGKEDYEVGKEAGLDIISPVDIAGLLTEEAGKYQGKKARVVDSEIIEDLEKDNRLVYKKKYSHDYPLCWRCESPLLMVSVPQWFLKISEIHSKLLKENEKTNWIPDYMKLRMKAWLEGISDWPVSRERYWGTPLPIWVCDKCDEKIVVGSINELEKLSGKKVKEVHKPEVDEIKIPCKCGGNMTRVSSVLDVWFDSGVSSWAALETEENIKKYWPADLNIEGKDQFRGWWNSQIILSQIRFDKKPFENISVHGMVLDLGKKKMSKSKGNVIAPSEVIEKYSRDFLRYYFAKISKGEDFSFDESEFKDIGKIFMMLDNIKNFIYQIKPAKKKIQIEDKWILSKFNSFVKNTTELYNKYKITEVIRNLEIFLVEDLSKTYIKMIRDRSEEVKEVLEEIYLGILKMFAPIIPFKTEEIWQSLEQKEESIHLSEFPKADKKKIDENLESTMKTIFQIIEKGLFARDKAQIGLKWPLPKVIVYAKGKENYEKLEGIIKSQLNVKGVEYKSPASKETELLVELDTKITSELEAEGYSRNIIRNIQAFRKQLGLQQGYEVETIIVCDDKLKEMLEEYKKLVAEKTNSKVLNVVTELKQTFKNKTHFKIKDKEGEIVIIDKK